MIESDSNKQNRHFQPMNYKLSDSIDSLKINFERIMPENELHMILLALDFSFLRREQFLIFQPCSEEETHLKFTQICQTIKMQF